MRFFLDDLAFSQLDKRQVNWLVGHNKSPLNADHHESGAAGVGEKVGEECMKTTYVSRVLTYVDLKAKAEEGVQSADEQDK